MWFTHCTVHVVIWFTCTVHVFMWFTHCTVCVVMWFTHCTVQVFMWFTHCTVHVVMWFTHCTAHVLRNSVTCIYEMIALISTATDRRRCPEYYCVNCGWKVEEPSPCETNSSSASQEMPHTLWNWVHCAHLFSPYVCAPLISPTLTTQILFGEKWKSWSLALWRLVHSSVSSPSQTQISCPLPWNTLSPCSSLHVTERFYTLIQ